MKESGGDGVTERWIEGGGAKRGGMERWIERWMHD